ncbi:hypothetical protein [Campylobacter sp.]|uniref:hypothetical protein n=1 Tax=Campylobacter sp. TaxID=205 RepID=UPI002A840F92|nr:hypothetical protein [Campylobacter sp.]MDY4445876.1 hypothetical protein [Campylobacter sp.]
MNNNDLCIKIPPYKINIFSKPIRNKNDCVSILLETVENFIYHNEAIKEIQNNTMLLENGRLFVFLENKYFSIKFPFQIKIEEKIKFYISNIELNSIILSAIRYAFLNISNSIRDILSQIKEEYEQINKDEIEEIIIAMLLLDDGYLRYDHDAKNENGKLHPLDHLDIFYTNNSVKLGLRDRLSQKNFVKIISKKYDECCYLENLSK